MSSFLLLHLGFNVTQREAAGNCPRTTSGLTAGTGKLTLREAAKISVWIRFLREFDAF
jgi:hypothetical protein